MNSLWVLKKNSCKNSCKNSTSPSPPELARTLINELPQISRSSICRVLRTSRANSYRISKFKTKDELLVKGIQAIRLNNPYYGVRRLKLAFRNQGQVEQVGQQAGQRQVEQVQVEQAEQRINKNISLNRLRRVCNTYNLHSKQYSGSWIKRRDRNLDDTCIPNRLKELQSSNLISRPNQVWCADFTYLRFQGYWYYLATLIDVYTKEIVGFHLSINHSTNLILCALNTAITSFGIPELTHNDQGSEYRSEVYLEYLRNLNITASNSAKSSPWENGVQESFYGKFKVELELKKLPFGSTFMDLYNYVANQIDYYNNYRIHTSIQEIPSNYRNKYNNNLVNANKKEENLVSQELVP